MIYKHYTEIVWDNDYLCELREMDHPYSHTRNIRKKICKAWEEKMLEKLEKTRQSDTPFGVFIRKNMLKLIDIKILVDILCVTGESPFDRLTKIDPFARYRKRYESSILRKRKLVYRIINPMAPGKAFYEVSYKAQLEIEGKPYTEEYQQLDMALEDESRRTGPDQMDGLFYAIKPTSTFNDLVADDELKEKLETAVARAKSGKLIFDKWGIGETIPYGRGTTLNFRGPPGTGKTMAANCIAHALGKQLLIVRYDQVQSMFVGETEKHIQRIFRLAAIKNAVLFFDEADAIAHNRATLSQSWEMSSVNTLLKELERYEGVCIFATNFADKYDKAFERRLTMHLDFKLPSEEQAIMILDKLLPKKARAKDLKLDGLKLSNLSGGDIKNMVLNAAGMAARDGRKIERRHIAGCLTGQKKEELAYVG